MQSGAGHTIRGNAIFSNGGLGIDLGDDGVTLNDPGDGDAGANGLQNAPVLTSASVVSGTTQVVGTLSSTAGTTFQIDYYASTFCDPSGLGEGQTYLGSTTATGDGGGTASFTATDLAAVANGSKITATATNPAGNTSEFSACQTVGVPPPVVTACTPRPRVQTRVATGGGRLLVELEPTALNSQQNNRIVAVNFGQLQNARVTLNGQPVVSGQVFSAPPHSVQVDLVVERVTPGQATTVPFTVVDTCGEWQTIVGGGTAAGF